MTTDKKRGLGRGLGALIPTSAGPSVVTEALLTPSKGSERTPAAGRNRPDLRLHTTGSAGDPKVYYDELPAASITANPRQPRQTFDDEAMAELVHSLKEVGLLQPIVVRPTTPGKYELVAGERRWRAAQSAGFERIPAIVRDTADDALLRDALLENLHRSELNPLEEAAAYGQLMSDFGCTQEQLAKRIGRSRPQISNTLRLLKLPAKVQRRVAAGVLSAGHARALLVLDSAKAQETLADRIVAEGLSVRAAEEFALVNGDHVSVATKRRKAGQKRVFGDLAAALGEEWETRVDVELGRTKGKLTVAFASVDDLKRIVTQIAPAAAGTLSAIDSEQN